jgi:hypothetical protein
VELILTYDANSFDEVIHHFLEDAEGQGPEKQTCYLCESMDILLVMHYVIPV